MTSITVDIPSVIVEITPAKIAEAFWNMDSKKQAEFFVELSNRVKNEWGEESHYGAEFQWMSMARRIKESSAHEFAKHFAECILYEENK